MPPKKILIIEDSRDLADSLEDMLAFKGYTPIKANNGAHGLSLAKVEKPDLILLDLKLPDMDGFDVFRKLREDEWGKTARILILTASDSSEAVPEDVKVLGVDILHKPQWGIQNIASRIELEFNK